MGESYYDVLEVPEDATEAEIRSAYRERVLETHPDQNDDPDAAAAFERVKRAEAVLTDGGERARYDRLGHEAYLELEGGGTSSPSGTSTDSTGTESEGQTGTTTSESSTYTGRASTSRRAAGRKAGTATERSRTDTGRSGPSHHARQRQRRQRKKATTDWFLGEESPRDQGGPTAEPTDDTRSEFSIHDWDGEVENRRDRPDIEQSTWVVICVFTALYPALVYSSVTPAFPLIVNVVVAACTLALVGYLLTIPHVAVAVFGAWSVVGPAVFLAVIDPSPRSLPFLGLVGATWVPFGYAIVVRWALRQ
ncbi:J domain-containing protein [Natrialbaceae archaeon A-gly3]